MKNIMPNKNSAMKYLNCTFLSSNYTLKLILTRLGVDKVKPKVWFKYSLKIDY